MRPHDRVDDGEPEARASLGAGPRRVGAREALEDPLVGAVGQARTLVGYLDQHRVVDRVRRERDRVGRLACT